MLKHIYLITFATWYLFAGLWVGSASAEKEKAWPTTINTSLEYLLEFADPGSQGDFKIQKCTPLFAFLFNAPDPNQTIYVSGDSSNPAAYYHFEIKKSLKELIQYAFNPDISTVLLRPSSVRLARWSNEKGNSQKLPKMWTYLSELDSPVLVRGEENIEITPDTNSGTYFSYDMDRTFILFTYQERKVMISLSRQKDKSEVGKKGLILGPDDNWDYVYTGEKGVNKRGLGWVRSRIYRSHNVTIFFENNGEGRSVQCAIFNWIKAGWAGLNMVKYQHIYNGIKRFSHDFKMILEQPGLPAPNKLALQLARFENMSTLELKDRTRLYLERLEQRYPGREKQLTRLLADPDYVEKLQREEMISLMVREYAKVLTGKQTAESADYLLGQLQETKTHAEKIMSQ